MKIDFYAFNQRSEMRVLGKLPPQLAHPRDSLMLDALDEYETIHQGAALRSPGGAHIGVFVGQDEREPYIPGGKFEDVFVDLQREDRGRGHPGGRW